ncbi:MAG: hypothetical protein MUF12_10300 [Sediminibacterium sp.]|nr:hypothetical protein [Sediminibacterium sp.]
MCNGTGKVTSTLVLEDEMEKRLQYLVTHGHKQLRLEVHPIVFSHLSKGWLWSSIIHQWKKKYTRQLKVEANNQFHLIEFRFFDANEEEIKF